MELLVVPYFLIELYSVVLALLAVNKVSMLYYERRPRGGGPHPVVVTPSRPFARPSMLSIDHDPQSPHPSPSSLTSMSRIISRYAVSFANDQL